MYKTLYNKYEGEKNLLDKWVVSNSNHNALWT